MVDGSEQSSKAMVFRRLFIHYFFMGVGLILILLVWWAQWIKGEVKLSTLEWTVVFVA
jgi:hypothetical protein